MAAVAAHALALSSEAALLAGKPGTGNAQASAADSPFAAMLSQMMGGTSLQGATAAVSSSIPAGATTPAGQISSASSALASPARSFSAILPGGVPSYAQSLDALQSSFPSNVPPTASLATAAFAQSRRFATAQPSASSISPSGLTSANANLSGSANLTPSSQAAMQLASSTSALTTSAIPQNPAQQAASSWLRQMMAAGSPAGASGYPTTPPNTSANLPAGVASLAGSLGAAMQPPGSSPTVPGFSAQSGSQQTTAALLQQVIAASQRMSASPGASTAANASPPLPASIASYLQAQSGTTPQFTSAPPAGTGMNAPSVAQQTPASLLQQMIAASANVSSYTTQAPPVSASSLPAGVSSYGQSMNAVSPLFAGASATSLMSLHATGMPQLQSLGQSAAPTAPSQTTQNAPPQTPAAQSAASADVGPWSAAPPPATILSADSTQSVAAMFGVPAFPAAMAFANPSAGKSQPAVQGGAANTGSLIPNTTKNATATGTVATATPGNDMQAGQAATAQSPQSTAAGNQAPAATTESSKAATLAQAAESSVRQGHSAPITEAQTLPLQFDLTDAKANTKQDSSHTTASDETDEAETSPSSAPAPQTTPSALSDHPATTPSPTPPLPAAIDAPAAPAPTIAGSQASAGSLQQVPQAATPLPATQGATPLAAPDINQLALNIAAKSLDGAKQFDIRLDPVELGRVDVRLSVDSSGMAQAHLAAERPETLALLQSNSGTLTRALQDSGVQVASNGLQFSLKGQDKQTEGQQRASSRNRGSTVQGIAAAGAMNNASSSYSLSPTGAGVNILV